MLQITKRELFFHRKNAYETVRSYGVPCTVFSISTDMNEAYDFYQDILDKDTSYVGSADTWINYEEYPNIRTLRSLGWYLPDGDESISIGYIPNYYAISSTRGSTFSPRIDDRLDITVNPYDGNISTRSFLIKDIRGNGFPSVIYYTVRLVPYHIERS